MVNEVIVSKCCAKVGLISNLESFQESSGLFRRKNETPGTDHEPGDFILYTNQQIIRV